MSEREDYADRPDSPHWVPSLGMWLVLSVVLLTAGCGAWGMFCLAFLRLCP